MSSLQKNTSTDSLVRNDVLALDFLRGGKAAMERKDNSLGRTFTAILFGFVLLFLLVTLLIGIRVYGAVNEVRTSNNETRMGLSLIANTVRMKDTVDSVRKEDGPEGPALVLTERAGGNLYETRIYRYQGNIVEENWIASHPFTPDTANEIVPSGTFDFSMEDGLLTIHTDQGSTSVALRSESGGSL